MEDKDKSLRDDITARLNRIEGQVRGIRKMVENDRKCLDVVRQVAATDAALRAVAKMIVTEHLDTCFAEAMDDPAARRQLFKEVLESFGRF